MKTSEIFGLVVRVAGFFLIIYGLWNLWAGIEAFPESLFGKVKGAEQPPDATVFSYFAFGIPEVAFGAFCFFGADWIARLAYRNQ